MRYEPQGGAGQDRLDETTATICREIRTLIAKGDAAGEEFYREAGQQIKELKRLHPDRWLVMVREECGLGRSRAFELMAIADGRTTAEEVRSNHTQRKRISRKRQAESGTSRTPEPAAMPVATVVSISAASDEQIGAFLDQLSIDHFFAVLQFAPTLQAEITKRVLALHDRKVALPIAAPNADSSSQTNVLDSIKQSRAVAEAYRKILKVSPFDRGAKKEISGAIELLIGKWRSVQSTLAGDTDTKAAAPTTDFAAAMAKAEFAEAKRKGTRPRSSKQIAPKLPKPDETLRLAASTLEAMRAAHGAPTKH